MTEKRDSLGRRIPTYDRSAQAKKAQANRKEREGDDVHARIGAIGGKRRARGYFGNLKDQGKTDELAAISRAASEKSRSRTPQEKHESSVKGWETRRRNFNNRNRKKS